MRALSITMDSHLITALVWVAEHPSGTVLLLLAALGFVFRGRLTTLWTFDVERFKSQLQREQAELLAKHQRELEAYKVSLIAETERAKAAQDVAKSLALRVAERRFDAIIKLQEVSAALAAGVPTLAGTAFTDAESHRKQWSKMMVIHQELRQAYSVVTPFIPISTRKQVLGLMRPCALALNRYRVFEEVAGGNSEDDGLLAKCLVAGVALEVTLASLLEGYETMTPPAAGAGATL